MARYRLKAFGIAREILGGSTVEIESGSATVEALRQELIERYPGLKALNSLYVAVNEAYAEDSRLLREADEIALIPPVSGG